MILWRFTIRELRNRPGRATLTLLSIVIAVAAIVAVTVCGRTTRRAYQEMYESLAGRTGLEVIADGPGLKADDMVAALENVAGVQVAVPLLQQPTMFYHRQTRTRLLALGIDPAHEEAIRDYDITAGALFENGHGAVLETGFARALGVDLGEEVKLLTRRGLKTLTVVGLLKLRGVASFKQAGIVLLPLDDAQRWYLRPGYVNTINLVLTEEARAEDVARVIAGQLPEGALVRNPAARSKLAGQTMASVEQGLSFAYATTLVLALVMILNTFLMNVKERRRQFAVLRAIGATRGQVVRMLLREGLVLGAAGTVLGCAAGLGGASLLTRIMAQVSGAALPVVRLDVWSCTVAALAGPAMALLATYIPAWQASRVTPLEALQPPVTEDSAPVPWWLVVGGVAFYGVTSLVLLATNYGWLPSWLTIPAGAASTAAGVPLVLILLRPLVRIAAALLRPLLGVEGTLACRQMLRRRVRTALTLSVLILAVSTAIGLGTTITNNVADVRAWLRCTRVGDFFVRGMSPDLSTGKTADISEEVAAEVAAVPGVQSVGTMRFVSADVGDQPVVVVVHDFAARDELPVYLTAGEAGTVVRQLRSGETVVGTVLAQRCGLSVGDQIELRTNAGVRRVTIAGLANEYVVGGLVLHMEREAAKRLFDVGGVDVLMVRAVPEYRAQAEAGLRAWAQGHGLMLHSFSELSAQLDGMLAGVVGGLWGLLVLGFVVAGFGIANTLTMNVLEQTRELALLRVVAMTRRQVAKTVLSQSLVLGVIGGVAGIVAGAASAYLINLTLYPLLGYRIAFAMNGVVVGSCLVLTLAIVLAASWIPARRAARLDLLPALKYE